MIRITTWADTQTLPDNLKAFLQNRFQFLCKVYAEDQRMYGTGATKRLPETVEPAAKPTPRKCTF